MNDDMKLVCACGRLMEWTDDECERCWRERRAAEDLTRSLERATAKLQRDFDAWLLVTDTERFVAGR